MSRTPWPVSLRKYLLSSMVFALLPAVLVSAAERRSGNSRRDSKPEPVNVEFFDAMKSGDIEVQFVPRDSTEASVRIKNKTKRPLSVKLPDAFAATPVLKQMGGMGMGGGGMGGGGMGGGGGGGQGMGGGMGGMGGGGMGGMGGGGMGGGGGGFFNIAAEKVARFNVPCVCLEHGKKEPRPAIPYEIKPLDSFSTDPKLASLLTIFGRGGIDQRATQAAAWHVANGMTWQQLAEKDNGPDELYFSQDQVRMAYELVSAAERIAAENPPSEKPEKSPGELDASKLR